MNGAAVRVVHGPDGPRQSATSLSYLPEWSGPLKQLMQARTHDGKPSMVQGDTHLRFGPPALSGTAKRATTENEALDRAPLPVVPPDEVILHTGGGWVGSRRKRVFDVVLAGGLLVLLSPVLCVVAIAIKLDSRGPVLFRQERVGYLGRPIRIVKFRTMRPDRRKCVGKPPGAERRRVHKSTRDPRVTRLGRILRRTCIDELPQLWNVLRGDLSLVGPRPELPEIVAQYETWQHVRHTAKPGLTGWWQVNRDGQRLMHEQTELDLLYLEKQSFLLDVQIVLRTVGVVFRGLGAF
jgi:lipopolysaccharide/colanic/teichoic acid biosynthesis glycosyltransferase